MYEGMRKRTPQTVGKTIMSVTIFMTFGAKTVSSFGMESWFGSDTNYK